MDAPDKPGNLVHASEFTLGSEQKISPWRLWYLGDLNFNQPAAWTLCISLLALFSSPLSGSEAHVCDVCLVFGTVGS